MSLIKTKGIEESNKNVQSEEVDVEPTSEESVESVEPNEEIERTPEESVESAEPSEKEKKIAAGAAAVGGILGWCRDYSKPIILYIFNIFMFIHYFCH